MSGDRKSRGRQRKRAGERGRERKVREIERYERGGGEREVGWERGKERGTGEEVTERMGRRDGRREKERKEVLNGEGVGRE